ncbi:MAG: flagellar hook-basal body complex protein FliE [Candidatus Eremiobacteraeota bacterium]|nr:flagellar hook-basal body complex protein FliE [Candidatus Eremiobacteraeota bacterium]MCL5054588.1 flagellar hook-basal body complex protein FliE [Bacillota bacterium]
MEGLSTDGIQQSSLQPASLYPKSVGTGSKDVSFKDTVLSFLKNVNNLQLHADQTMREFAAGEIHDSAKVFLAVEKADLSLNLAVQIRNRLVDAYNTIIQMQV